MPYGEFREEGQLKLQRCSRKLALREGEAPAEPGGFSRLD